VPAIATGAIPLHRHVTDAEALLLQWRSLNSPAPGTRLGPYEIIAPLGAGGMGEVYRARDARLGREVAVKILAPRFAGDTAAVARFEREARAVAALSHPNILAIHDFGNDAGTVYAVSELLEGETLRARISGTPLPARRAIDYALQIARGLAAAHEKGIVHRDLKPENVFLTSDGRAKILDFGLAKLLPLESAGSGTQAPTIEAGTEPGVVLGTMGYMAPEQVRGKSADNRTDIFAFGAILYEMLSGRRAFHGDTAADTMTAILKEDPTDLSETGKSVSPALDRLVRHCLENSPAQRFQSASDLAYELESMTGASGSAAAHLPRRSRRLPRLPLLAALAGALAVGVLAGISLWRPRSAAIPSFRRVTYRRGNVGTARFAPDGQTVVYGASWEGAPVTIFSTRIGNPESMPLGYEKTNLMAVSSTGELAVSLRQTGLSGTSGTGTLARAPIGGGQPRPVLEYVDGADWSPDGKNLVIARFLDGKSRLEFPAGKVLYVSTTIIDGPRFSPRGDRIAFVERQTDGTEIDVVDLRGRLLRLPGRWQGVSTLAWGPAGRSLWFAASGTQGDSAVYEIDLSGRARVKFSMPDASNLFDVAPDGRILLERYHPRRAIVVYPPSATTERDLAWFDLSDLTDMSDDGSTILFTERAAAADRAGSFFLRRTDGSPAVKLGDGEAFALSPDGQFVLARLAGSAGLSLVPTGAGPPVPLDTGGVLAFGEGLGSVGFLPAGRKIWFTGASADRRWRLYTQAIPGGKPVVFDEREFNTTGAPVSPDGRALVAFRDWKEDLSVLRFDGSPPRAIPGTALLDPIRWSVDGLSVYAIVSGSVPGHVVKVDVATGRREPFRDLMPAGVPTVLRVFNPRFTPDGAHYAYGYSSAASSDLYVVEGLR